MPYETLLLETTDRVATLTLNRPEKRNAINRRMLEELVDALESISADDRVRVLVVTGAADSFCAGADLDIMPGGDNDKGDLAGDGVEELRRSDLFKAVKRIILGLHQMEKPTIAMINGPCVGAGLDLALACDLRTASPNAKFLCGFVKLGLFPGFGAAWLYPRTMGLAKALEMLFTGDPMDVHDAQAAGMLNTVASSEDLPAVTRALATKVAMGPSIAIRHMKRQVYKGLGTDLPAALEDAALIESITIASEDFTGALAALRKGDKPSFS